MMLGRILNMSRLLSISRVGSLVLAAASINAAIAQAKPSPGAMANREYAAVFAHPANPCSADSATVPFLDCMDKELDFIELHLDAFIEALRGLTDSPEELAALNQTDATWRNYRKSACALPYSRYPDGTIKGPMTADCRFSLDRAYMEQLSGTYILSQQLK
jgi:uncharacterized protein YecT (DUF1311 family)